MKRQIIPLVLSSSPGAKVHASPVLNSGRVVTLCGQQSSMMNGGLHVDNLDELVIDCKKCNSRIASLKAEGII